MPFVTAGAYSREIDLSLFVETNSNTTTVMAHIFNKGVIGEATLVTNLSRLQELFGAPIDPSIDSSASQGWFAAREYLRHGNKLYVTRVESAATPAEFAAQSLQGSTDETLSSGTDGATSIPGTRELTSAGAAFDTDGVKVGDILEIAEPGADDGFYVITIVAPTVLTVNRDWPTGSLAAQDFTVHVAKRLGGADGATSTSSGRQLTSATGTFTDQVREDDILEIGDASDTGDNGVYRIIRVVSDTVVEVDRDWPIGALATLTFRIYGHSSLGADGDTSTPGEFVSAGAAFDDHGVKTGDILWIKDLVDTANNGFFSISDLKTGSEATTLEVNEAVWAASLTGLDFEVLPGSILFTGLTKGLWANGYDLRGRPNALTSTDFNLETKDGDIVLENVGGLNRANVVSEMADNSGLYSATVITSRGEPVIGKTFEVTGGANGNAGVLDSDFIGNSLLKTGLKSFRNKELIEGDIAICPGQSSQNVEDELIDLAESRGDMIAIVDPPDFPTIDTVQEVLDFHNGTNIRTTALNSSYGALYWPWVQVFDEFHDLDVYTAPSGHMAGVYTQNDNQQFPWFAPAGFKRGKLKGAKDLRTSPDQDQRDSLNGPGANVNPISNFTGAGIHAFGQKTLQRATTALDRVNVRRMLTFAKRAIEKAARQLVFDPNDPILWREFKQLVEPTLKFILANRGINEFLILADETTTTPQVQEQNKMIAKLFIKPTKSAEIIEIQFIITSQGANFAELAA